MGGEKLIKSIQIQHKLKNNVTQIRIIAGVVILWNYVWLLQDL